VRELPEGTVTLLFTDIEGSTRLLHELGDRYAEVLREHRRVLREAFEQHGGTEVDTQGDAFLVAFGRAGDAIASAASAQQELADGPVRVRIGIHTGEPLRTEEGYVGIDVHRAARIMGAGHGGQVVVSETTQRLLDPAVVLRDLGEHRLKDLSAPQRLYQLGDADFPPLKALHRTNLPIQPTPLIGRERELDEAGALIASQRLVTLTGPGGSGKTRLSLQLAAEAVERFPDGVFWVPLQALRDPALVEHAVATSIGADRALPDFLGRKQLLVVLDNFEQLLEAAPAVSGLLAATPSVKVLVTSREPLQVDGEHRYPVDPLADEDAASLFLERARAVAPGFRGGGAVVHICRRLDGLPLAIELAAARVALLEPDELLARLERRLPLLASGARDAPERQRTLRATIEWSHELLEPDAQDLFRRLAVFRGSFSLESAEAVCDADLDAVESLVVKSLVRRWGSGRIGMLDTIREFAVELLDGSPDVDEVRRRHARHFLTVAESTNLSAGNLRPGGQRLDLAIPEHDNFRGALAWAIRSGDIELGLEIATALEQLWVADDPSEGVRWFERLLETPHATGVPTTTRAHALRAYGSSAHISGDPALAARLWEESLALFDALGDEHGRAVLLHRLGIIALHRGDLDRARALLDESDGIHRKAGDRWGMAQSVGTLGAVARDAGDAQLAAELIAESATLARDVGVRWWEGGMLAELACLSLGAGRLDEADTDARASLELAEELRDRSGRVFGVGILAGVAAGRGEQLRAGRLWGAIEDEDALAPLGGWRRHRDAVEARVRASSGPELERGLAEGRELTLDEATSAALESG
jgi:predicted ATPase/class 3 adenylate cyclase